MRAESLSVAVISDGRGLSIALGGSRAEVRNVGVAYADIGGRCRFEDLF